jgi:hypothetical protein
MSCAVGTKSKDPSKTPEVGWKSQENHSDDHGNQILQCPTFLKHLSPYQPHTKFKSTWIKQLNIKIIKV